MWKMKVQLVQSFLLLSAQKLSNGGPLESLVLRESSNNISNSSSSLAGMCLSGSRGVLSGMVLRICGGLKNSRNIESGTSGGETEFGQWEALAGTDRALHLGEISPLQYIECDV